MSVTLIQILWPPSVEFVPTLRIPLLPDVLHFAALVPAFFVTP